MADPNSLPTPGGTILDEPRQRTAATQQAYARAVLADPTPPDPSDSLHRNSFWFRKLRYEQQVPLELTWDAAAVRLLTENDRPLWDFLEDICQALATPLYGTQGAYLREPLSKVKALLLSTTEAAPQGSEREHGYVKSFDPATGVLTLAMTTHPSFGGRMPSSLYGSEELESWLITHLE